MKVLFVGLGGIGQRHLRNLRALYGDAVEVIAFRTRGLSRTLTDKLEIDPGADLEAKYGVRSYRSLDEALAARPDAAFICNPSGMHVPVALAAASAGCHLFLEKPLSDSLDGVGELADLVESKKLATLVAYQLRFHPLVRGLRALLDARAIGRVLAVKAEVGEWLPGFHLYEDYREMYASKRALGGGVVVSQIHEFDYLYSLFGLPRRVFAMGGHLSSLEIDVEDLASVSMQYERDGRTLPVHLHQDYLQRPPTRTCVVLGDEGRLEIDFHALRLRHHDGKGRLAQETSFPGFERNQMFLDELTHFFACIEGKQTSIVPVREGIESLRMALAARQSLETGRIVDLEEVQARAARGVA